MKFYCVQLRIAVQSCPAGAAHPDRFGIMPFHGKPSDDRHAAIRELDPRPCYKDAAKGENVTEILYDIEKTILLVHPPATPMSRREVRSRDELAKKLKKTGKRFGEPN